MTEHDLPRMIEQDVRDAVYGYLHKRLSGCRVFKDSIETKRYSSGLLVELAGRYVQLNFFDGFVTLYQSFYDGGPDDRSTYMLGSFKYNEPELLDILERIIMNELK